MRTLQLTLATVLLAAAASASVYFGWQSGLPDDFERTQREAALPAVDAAPPSSGIAGSPGPESPEAAAEAPTRRRLGPEAFARRVLDIIRSEDPDLSGLSEEERAETLPWLARDGREVSLVEVREGLDDESARVREAAVEALGEAGDEASADRLRDLALSDVPSVRRAAIEALGELGASEQLAEIAAADDVPAELREQVVDALDEIQLLDLDTATTSALLGLIRDPDPSIRSDVYSALADSSDPSAIQPLWNHFYHGEADFDLRDEILDTIEDLGEFEEVVEAARIQLEQDCILAGACFGGKLRGPYYGTGADRTWTTADCARYPNSRCN